MGLIQFAKNVGRKIGLGDDDSKIQGQGPQQGQHASPSPLQVQELHDRRKAAALHKLCQDMGFKVQDLGVRVDGDKITLTGQAPSQEIREKIVLLVGNVEGIGSVDDHMKAVEAAPEAHFYEVKSGDTLSKIAKEYYGDANKYNHIFEANRPMLKGADEIYPGQRLRIPSAARQRAESFGGPDASGSYEYCFPAGTQIEMADGSLRAISEISVGDLVRCWNHGQDAMAQGRVEFALSATVDRLVRLNGQLSASPAHRVFTAGGYVRFDEIQIGDFLLRSPGTIPEPVTQVEAMSGSFSVFNLVVGTFACFFAEGLLVEDQIGAELAEEGAGTYVDLLLSEAV